MADDMREGIKMAATTTKMAANGAVIAGAAAVAAAVLVGRHVASQRAAAVDPRGRVVVVTG